MKYVALICSALTVVSGCDEAYRPAPKEGGERHAGPTREPPQPAPALAPEAGAGDLGPAVVAGRVRLKAPESWRRQPPRSQFTLADFALPKAEGDEQDGRLTVSVAGGSVDANIERWRGQFSGDVKQSDTQEIEVGGVKLSVVDLSGTYNDQPGPFAAGVPREGYRMLAAIAPVDGQLHFIKAYGPAKTMAAHEAAFQAFLRTIEVQ